MSETKKVLQMIYTNAENKDVRIRLSNPKANLTAAAVQSAMELFSNLRVFNSISSMGVAKLKGAKIVATQTSDFEISIA